MNRPAPFETQAEFTAWALRTPAGQRNGIASDAASLIDRKWFAANRGKSQYFRQAVPDELPCVECGEILVTQIREGVRSRTAVPNGLNHEQRKAFAKNAQTRFAKLGGAACK